MKAIETHYNGYRFRSRLEARWAVFFDTAGIAYQYEPEGYELSDGSRYLPDFLISIAGPKGNPGVWFEVKPDNAPHDPRHDLFAREAGVPVIVARGMPANYSAQLAYKASALQCWTEGNWTPAAFVGERDPDLCTHGSEMYCALGDGRHWCTDCLQDYDFGQGGPHLALMHPAAGHAPHVRDLCGWNESPNPDKVTRAYVAAREARFEFGETPRFAR